MRYLPFIIFAVFLIFVAVQLIVFSEALRVILNELGGERSQAMLFIGGFVFVLFILLYFIKKFKS